MTNTRVNYDCGQVTAHLKSAKLPRVISKEVISRVSGDS